VSTAGYVKLLLPPRQSRGNSHWGLEKTLIARKQLNAVDAFAIVSNIANLI
jgi:hypothetical protein